MYVCMYVYTIRVDDRLPSDRHVRSDSQLRRTRRRTMSCIPASSTRGLSDRLDRRRSLDRRTATRARFYSALPSADILQEGTSCAIPEDQRGVFIRMHRIALIINYSVI